MALRYALIGSGMMGQEHIRNIALIEGATLTAIADTDEAMRHAALATAGQCGMNGVRAFTDYRDLLSAGLADCLVVATPNDTHHAVMIDVLETGLPVLLEKPATITGATARDLEQRAARRSTPVWVAMEYRYMPAIRRVIEAAQAGSVGRVHMVSIVEHRFPFLVKVGNWNRFSARSGGTLVEKCCHFFDLMRLLTGGEPVRVYASGAQDVNHRDEHYEAGAPDIIDNAFVIVDFDNGMRAALDLCMFAEGSWWQEQVAVTGETGKVQAFVPGPPRFWRGDLHRPSEFVFSPRAEKAPLREEMHLDETIAAAGDHHGSTFYQHQRFAAMIREGSQPEVTLADGRAAVEMGEAAEQSVRTGLPVRFPSSQMEAAE